jgi:hypothetical protein
MKTEKLQTMKQLFEKNMVLTMSGICTSIKGTTMRTIIRYLNEIGYYSSYNHAGMYYTITGIPEFDEHGLWGYREALFSSYGNLKETICTQIEVSEAGMTNDELSVLLHVNTKSTLTAIAARADIFRSKSCGVYVYYSVDPERRDQQKNRRFELHNSLDSYAEFIPHDIVYVLATYINGIRTPEQVTAHLRRKGHSIRHSVVADIFERFELEYDGNGKKNTL